MIVEIGCIAVGVPAGYLLRTRPAVVGAVDRLTTWSIYALLFLLGLSLGSDDALVAKAGDIGLRAVVISMASLAGSVAAGWLLQHVLLRGALDGPSPGVASPAPQGADATEALTTGRPEGDRP
ncbi:LysO family transporter [Nitratidesulfovibrio termitidis]|uniref:LysO family transporter n=1 Tax=Nitratidesulfovibrio termitidis TaxID=42252 RepID=UPI00042620A8|nr:LysO family transporter [Nitratidesulfovibrio termitidis]